MTMPTVTSGPVTYCRGDSLIILSEKRFVNTTIQPIITLFSHD